jgi:hypothetical protein
MDRHSTLYLSSVASVAEKDNYDVDNEKIFHCFEFLTGSFQSKYVKLSVTMEIFVIYVMFKQ